MAKKHKSHDDDSTIDDEPEADWTEDTEAEGRSPEGVLPSAEQQPAPVEEPKPPPGTRLKAVLVELEHAAEHNAPVGPPLLKALREIAEEMGEHLDQPPDEHRDLLHPRT